jgi:anti-sigma-K factor RskA
MVTITKNRLRTTYERAARALEAEQAASDQALPPIERQRVVAERAAEERRGWWRLRIMFVGMAILATIAIYVASLSSASPAP